MSSPSPAPRSFPPTGGKTDTNGGLRVSVIIVNYETSRLVARCVDSLKSQPVPPEIVVVDNPSSTRDAEALAGLDAIIIRNDSNIGYGLGCNTGAAHASGDLICILNPDTVVPRGELDRWVESLGTLTNRGVRVGLMAPRLANENGTIQRSTYRFVGFLTYWLYHSLLAGAMKKARKLLPMPDGQATSLPRSVDWVMGAALLIPRTAWDDIGGFSPRYFLYAEDTDLCWRLRQHGWDVMIDPAVTLIHSQGEASAHSRDAAIVRFFTGLATFIGLRYGAVRCGLVRTAVILDMLLRLALLAPVVVVRPRSILARNRALGYLRVLRLYTTMPFPPPPAQ